MRETEILRGLHGARGKLRGFAGGAVPAEPPATSFRGMSRAFGKLFESKPKPPAPTAPTPEASSGAESIGQAVAPGFVNAVRSRKQLLDNLAGGMAPRDVTEGVASLDGPGTTTSDSILAKLSRKEAVLPAKTVQAVGAENIAQLIEDTTGKAPQRGLRGGGGYRAGAIPGMEATEFFEPEGLPTKEEQIARLKKQPAPAIGNTTSAPGNIPPGNGAHSTTPPDTLLKGRAASAFTAGKSALGSMANSAVSPLKTGYGLTKGLGMGALGGYAGDAAADAARSIDKPLAGPSTYVDDPRAAAIPTDGESAAPAKQPYNWFTDTDTGRNVGTNLNAVAAIPGVGPVARSALGMGTGALSRAARAAGGPLTAGALQGAAASVREGGPQTAEAPATEVQANPYAATTASAYTRLQRQDPLGPNDNPYHGDLTAPINGAMQNGQTGLAATGMRANDVYKTRQANGTTAYSGYGDGSGTGGGLVAGDGTPLAGRGTVSVMPNDQTSRTTSSGQDAALSAGLRAAVERGDIDAVRAHYQRAGGTWQGSTQEQDTDARLTQALETERNPKKLAGLQAAMKARSDKAQTQAAQSAAQATGLREQQRMVLDARKQDLDELRYTAERGDKKDAATQAATERGTKEYDEFLKMNPSLYDQQADGKAPVFNEQKAAALGSYLAETAPEVMTRDGKQLSLQEAFARANPDARSAMVKAGGDMALREFAHNYSLNSLNGKGTKAGALKILRAPRASEMGDLMKSLQMGDYAATKLPWVNNQVVEVEGTDGPIALPLKEIMALPNGRELMDAILRNSPNKK